MHPKIFRKCTPNRTKSLENTQILAIFHFIIIGSIFSKNSSKCVNNSLKVPQGIYQGPQQRALLLSFYIKNVICKCNSNLLQHLPKW